MTFVIITTGLLLQQMGIKSNEINRILKKCIYKNSTFTFLLKLLNTKLSKDVSKRRSFLHFLYQVWSWHMNELANSTGILCSLIFAHVTRHSNQEANRFKPFEWLDSDIWISANWAQAISLGEQNSKEKESRSTVTDFYYLSAFFLPHSSTGWTFTAFKFLLFKPGRQPLHMLKYQSFFLRSFLTLIFFFSPYLIPYRHFWIYILNYKVFANNVLKQTSNWPLVRWCTVYTTAALYFYTKCLKQDRHKRLS